MTTDNPPNVVRPKTATGTRSRRRKMLYVFAGIVVVICIVALVGLWYVSALTSGAKKVGDEVQKVGAETESVVGGEANLDIPNKVASDSRYAFLLMGYGGIGHDGAYLTDSMMVAIADPDKKTLTLLSIPRDSWVPMLFNGKTPMYNKVNTAYAFAMDKTQYTDRLSQYSGSHGAGTFAKDTVARLLGIPISNYLALDFEGFREMIDAVGGVDVEVPASFTSLYPANDNSSIDSGWITVSFYKGTEHMTGERAIRFARAREILTNVSEGSDFARSRRQRLVMEAFKNKLLETSGLLHLPQILGISADHVDTDYSIPDVTQLGQFVLGWKDVKIYQTALTVNNYLEEGTGPSGTYLVAPIASNRSWSQIRAFCRRLWDNPELGVAMSNTRIIVSNCTGQSGVADKVSANLVKLGYRVGPPTTGKQRVYSRFVDNTGGQASLVEEQMTKALGLKGAEIETSSSAISEDLILEIGVADIAAADLQIAEDETAPSSGVGIVVSGGWAPSGTSSDDAEDEESVPTATTPLIGGGTKTPSGTTTPHPSSSVTPIRTGTVTPAGTATTTSGTTVSTPTPSAAVTPTHTPSTSGSGTPTPTPTTVSAGDLTPTRTATRFIGNP